MGTTIEKRIMITPSPMAAPFLLEFSRLTGKAPATIIREILDLTMPDFAPVIEALKVVEAQPDVSRKAVLEMLGNVEKALHENQLRLDLGMEKTPGRKPARVRSR